MIRKLVLTAAVIALAAPASAALAQDYPGQYGYGQEHHEDHHEHRDFHQDVGGEHQDLHEEGAFYSGRDHNRYHRATAREHRQVHRALPDTRHDHQRGYGNGGDYYGYQNGYAYGHYRR